MYFDARAAKVFAAKGYIVTEGCLTLMLVAMTPRA
jgi:hypothetical protein